MVQNLLFQNNHRMTAEEKDVVYTPDDVAKDMVEWFQPTGKILEPCKGGGVFLKYLPEGTDWCELQEGRNFYEYQGKVDWIVSNPPYSNYAKWVYHSMEVADNFAYLMPCDKPFISNKMLLKLREWGNIRHMRVYGPGHRLGFPIGYAIGAIHFQKGYRGGMTISYADRAF